jgi:hypothetical protein
MAYGTGIGFGPLRHTSITELRRVASHIVVPTLSGTPAPTPSAKAASQKGITSAGLVPKTYSLGLLTVAPLPRADCIAARQTETRRDIRTSHILWYL